MVLEAYSGMLSVLATIFGTAMSFAYIPQIYKIYKRKSVADISLIMYLVFFPGLVIWLLYGISIDNIPLIIANMVGVVCAAIIIIEYFIYRK